MSTASAAIRSGRAIGIAAVLIAKHAQQAARAAPRVSELMMIGAPPAALHHLYFAPHDHSSAPILPPHARG
jgi:hypothetical protein